MTLKDFIEVLKIKKFECEKKIEEWKYEIEPKYYEGQLDELTYVIDALTIISKTYKDEEMS